MHALDAGTKQIGEGKDMITPTQARDAVLALYRAGMNITKEEEVKEKILAWGLAPASTAELDRTGIMGKDGGGT